MISDKEHVMLLKKNKGQESELEQLKLETKQSYNSLNKLFVQWTYSKSVL